MLQIRSIRSLKGSDPAGTVAPGDHFVFEDGTVAITVLVQKEQPIDGWILADATGKITHTRPSNASSIRSTNRGNRISKDALCLVATDDHRAEAVLPLREALPPGVVFQYLPNGTLYYTGPDRGILPPQYHGAGASAPGGCDFGRKVIILWAPPPTMPVSAPAPTPAPVVKPPVTIGGLTLDECYQRFERALRNEEFGAQAVIRRRADGTIFSISTSPEPTALSSEQFAAASAERRRRIREKLAANADAERRRIVCQSVDDVEDL